MDDKNLVHRDKNCDIHLCDSGVNIFIRWQDKQKETLSGNRLLAYSGLVDTGSANGNGTIHIQAMAIEKVKRS